MPADAGLCARLAVLAVLLGHRRLRGKSEVKVTRGFVSHTLMLKAE